MTTGTPQTLRAAVNRAMEHAGSIPANEAVKLRPADWHAVTAAAEAMARAYEALQTQLDAAETRHRTEMARVTAQVAAGTYADLGPSDARQLTERPKRG